MAAAAINSSVPILEDGTDQWLEHQSPQSQAMDPYPYLTVSINIPQTHSLMRASLPWVLECTGVCPEVGLGYGRALQNFP